MKSHSSGCTPSPDSWAGPRHLDTWTRGLMGWHNLSFHQHRGLGGPLTADTPTQQVPESAGGRRNLVAPLGRCCLFESPRHLRLTRGGSHDAGRWRDLPVASGLHCLASWPVPWGTHCCSFSSSRTAISLWVGTGPISSTQH